MTEWLLSSIGFIPIYGLMGAILTLPWSMGIVRRTGPRPAAYFNILMTLVAFIHNLVILRSIWQQPPQRVAFHWLQVADLDLTLTLDISPISMGALSLVISLSLLAQLYALGYMEKDWSLARFYGLMGFFEAALSGLAISDSLLLSYGLLEMLTLSTYLLVGFWYAQPLVVTAARDAFLTKRVGDILLLMGVVALSSYGEGLDFSQLKDWVQTAPLQPFTATLLGLALIAGPTGKCAQFPLNLWLDEAMEGPNPAGILRNSIVVSAGAYVLIKLQPVFTLSLVASNVLVAIGAITAVGASLMAIAQIDIKRALSHSTSAYLGLVFVTVGIGQPVTVALLLLFAHAIAKALLFMSAGSIIFNTTNQNVTQMGGLWSRMPATTVAFMVGSAGLIALLPMGMFWSMQQWLQGFYTIPLWLLMLLLFVNGASAVNLTRLFRLVFLGQPHPKTRRCAEVPWPMAVPMVTLSLLVLLMPVGLQQLDLLVRSNNGWVEEVLLLNHWAMPVLIASGMGGCLLGALMPLRRNWERPTQVYLRFFQDLFAYDFYIERLYNVTVVWAVSLFSRFTAWFDRYIVDGGVNLVGLAAIFSGNALKYNVSGQSQFYIFTILVAVSVILGLAFNGQWEGIWNYWSSAFSVISD
ncbi:MAG: NAD(P)H-quinone oxidoreductase subunit F [Jaaginema sp. PMC 1080.18]|nr:NAD(P)H-quinone oxidoreductase subunit F [Jaaginema sp. PMC 1080.18]MEC4865501.1 NAD(P)H-quinone oxidoreductase subunit F [Jaaginema sp. PMC 1078.18]